MKVDLCMWTKNGEKTLPKVLERIDEVIPHENVNKKILVDGLSTDRTTEIAKEFNWDVYHNMKVTISHGANLALQQVESDYFISFEQDLLLAKDWWEKIPLHLEDQRVAVASGIRFADKPLGLRRLQEYVYKKYRGEPRLASWLRSREKSAFTLGKTLDNTIYKTRVIRSLGGFPYISGNTGLDSVLAYKVKKAGFDWVVDYTVQSVHLRKGLWQELKHQQWYAAAIPEIHEMIKRETGEQPPITESGILFRLLISPATGLFVALKTKEPSVIYIHPLLKLYYAKGLMLGAKKKDEG